MPIDSYVSNSTEGVHLEKPQSATLVKDSGIRRYAFLIPFHDCIKYTRMARELENTDSELSKIARNYAKRRLGDDIFKIISLPFLGPAVFLFDFLDKESIWEMEKYVKRFRDGSCRT